MNLRELIVTGRSATFEICNGHAWQSAQEHQLLLNGREAARTAQNVFTLRGLESDSAYTITVKNGDELAELVFRTAMERFRVSVRAFGAVGNGVTDDTGALQAALISCPAGGVVEIPPGDWLSAPLFLKSGVDLYLARGARLVGHPDIDRWPLLPGTLSETEGSSSSYLGSWEGTPQSCHAALVNAIGVEDVRIHGEGCIDANASFESWWSRPKQPFRGWRPRTIYCVHARRIGISGITVRNSPSWTIHALFCRDVSLAHLYIESPPKSPNTDGIVPESCENVRIAGVRISTGDDCIAIKSGKTSIASRVSCATRNIEVSNCLMERGHGAIVIGSEMAGSVYDVSIRDCLIRETDRGLRIKTRRGRGPKAVVDGIRLDNVKMEHVGTPFVVNSFYFCDPDGRAPFVGDIRPLPVDDGTPTLRNITVTNVDCRDVAHSAGFVLGLPERPLEGLTIRGYRVRFDANAAPGFPDQAECIGPVARDGLYMRNVRGAVLEDIDIEGARGLQIRQENVEG